MFYLDMDKLFHTFFYFCYLIIMLRLVFCFQGIYLHVQLRIFISMLIFQQFFKRSAF